MNNEKTPKALRRRSGVLRWVLLGLAVLLVLLAAAWLLFPRALNPDRVIRFFRYMGLRDKQSYGHISFESGAGNVYAGFDDGLLVGTESGLTLYTLEGEQKAFIQGSLPTPVLRTGGEVSLLFSPGSSYAAAVGGGGAVLRDGALSGAFVNADVSFDGYTVYLSSESGYKAVATVLNPKQEPVYRFSSRTRYLNACAVSRRGTYLAAASLEETDSIYRSGVTILRTDRPLEDLEQENDAAVQLDLGNQMIYELRFLDETRLLVVAQNEIVFLNVEGQRTAQFSLKEGQLIDYALSEDGWLVLAVNENGGGSRVLTLNAEGKTLGEQRLPDRVRSVSAAGDYAAVLTERWLQTYDRKLTEYDRSWDTLGATRVVARDDGTALLIAGGGTKLFIP